MKRRFRKLCLLVWFAVLIAALALSAETSRPAWALTTEERIALRTDARLATERVRGAARIRVNVQGSGPVMADSFEGTTHPELFLPYEIFRMLVRQAYLGADNSNTLFHQTTTPMVEIYGLPSDFWQRLEVVAAGYIADTRAADALGATLRETQGRRRAEVVSELARIQSAVCASRAAALSAAREEFGREKFDRFLYEVVAIHMFHVADELPRIEDLRRAERGCQ